MSNGSENAIKAWATRRAKARRITPVSRLNALLKEQVKWQRREKIARSKLERVRRNLERLMVEVLRPKPAPVTDNPFAKRKIAA